MEIEIDACIKLHPHFSPERAKSDVMMQNESVFGALPNNWRNGVWQARICVAATGLHTVNLLENAFVGEWLRPGAYNDVRFQNKFAELRRYGLMMELNKTAVPLTKRTKRIQGQQEASI